MVLNKIKKTVNFTITQNLFYQSLWLTCCLSSAFSYADNTTDKVTTEQQAVTIIAHQDYGSSQFHQWLFGSDYRDLWTSPIEIIPLDLQTFADGLTPVKQVGQLQTLGLALKGNNGKAYTFRSVEKDPTKVLPAEFSDTIVADIIDDMVSADLPAASLVAAELIKAVGLLSSQPILTIMPDDPALGEFRETFAGVLGTLEEFPTNATFSSKKIISSEQLIPLLEIRPNQLIDSKSYLKVRLMDILLGDWDRHIGQLRWVQFDDIELWQPLPEDRDHAFSRYDGLLMSIWRDREPRFLEFGPDYSPLEGSAWRGRQLDRRLLSGLEFSVWHEVAVDIQTTLSNSAIEQAIAKLPPQWAEIKKDFLFKALVSRREKLLEHAKEFYLFLAAEVDIYTSNQGELILITPRDDQSLSISIIPQNEASSTCNSIEGKLTPRYQRQFNSSETQSIRVYSAANDDRVKVTNSNNTAIKIHLVGHSNPIAPCNHLDVPLTVATHQNQQLGKGQQLSKNIWLSPPKLESENPLLAHGEDGAALTAQRDWGDTAYGSPWAAYSPDLGAFVGYGRVWESFAFRKKPFATSHRLRAGYSFGRNSPKLDYRFDYMLENRPLRWRTELSYSGIDTINFYGFGNETQSIDSRLAEVQSTSSSLINQFIWQQANYNFAAGLILRNTDTEEQGLIGIRQPYGFDETAQLGLHLGFKLRSNFTKDTLRMQSSDEPARFVNTVNDPGYGVTIKLNHYPNVMDLVDDYSQLHIEGRIDYAVDNTDHLISLRLGGQKNWGTYPYYDAAIIGSRQVRGLASGRYSGDAALYSNAMLKLRAGKLRMIVPGHWGVLLRTDIGRVFLANESSQRWHPSAGIGTWWTPTVGATSSNLYLAKSKEDTRLYFLLGAKF